VVAAGDRVKVKDILAKGSFIHQIFYIDMSKLLLTLLFLFLIWLVYRAGIRNKLKTP
jgi:hypothetical protein